MGTYTEFHCKIRLSKNTPPAIIEILNAALLDHKNTIDSDHEFFKCERWHSLLSLNNAFHPKGKWVVGIFGAHYLELHIELKHRDDEIFKFIDWIKPYLGSRKRRLHIGWWNIEFGKQNHIWVDCSVANRPVLDEK